MKTAKRLLSALALLCLVGSTAITEEAPGQRSVDEILDEFEEALGGKKSWKRVKNVRMEFNVSIKGMGINGTATRLLAPRNQFYEVMSLPGIGKMEHGVVGKKHWSKDVINGLRILDGKEREQSMLETAWMSEFRMRKLYKRIRTIRSTRDELDCIELTPRSAPSRIRCFDRKSKLLVSESGKQISPHGETPFSLEYEDYRSVEGLKIAHRLVLTAGPIVSVMKVTKVETNVKVKASHFKMPKP